MPKRTIPMLEHYLKVSGPIGAKLKKYCGVCTDVTDEIKALKEEAAKLKKDLSRANATLRINSLLPAPSGETGPL